VRAIPTCVGTTPGLAPSGAESAGHPHVCGDYGERRGRRSPGPRAIPTCVGTTRAVYSPRRTISGPSPRVWGLRQRRRLNPGASRAIPTCVGTTRWPFMSMLTRKGHPHVCGDYWAAASSRSWRAGPSPRVWGLRGRPGDVLPGTWAIPTCVGTTASPKARPRQPAGHPHVRGDYWVMNAEVKLLRGPSPRAWGLLLSLIHISEPTRPY